MESKSTKGQCKNGRHDYKNAIKVGNVDYQCPLCGKMLDPLEWFFMNSFEFVDVKGEIISKNKKKGSSIAKKRICSLIKTKFTICGRFIFSKQTEKPTQ